MSSEIDPDIAFLAPLLSKTDAVEVDSCEAEVLADLMSESGRWSAFGSI